MMRKIIGTATGILLVLSTPVWAQSPNRNAASATTTGSTTTTSSFQNLSPGNQKIVNALFADQHPTGTQTTLTRDQIASLKGRQGWGRVFKQMKADGLTQSKNLGQVVSSYEHRRHTFATGAGGKSARHPAKTGGRGSEAARDGSAHSAATGNASGGVGHPATAGGFASPAGGGFGNAGMGGGAGGGHGGGHGR